MDGAGPSPVGLQPGQEAETRGGGSKKTIFRFFSLSYLRKLGQGHTSEVHPEHTRLKGRFCLAGVGSAGWEASAGVSPAQEWRVLPAQCLQGKHRQDVIFIRDWFGPGESRALLQCPLREVPKGNPVLSNSDSSPLRAKT